MDFESKGSIPHLTLHDFLAKPDFLAGKLQHAAIMVKPGRTFLCRIYNILATIKRSHHHIPMKNELKPDLIQWDTFLESLNGTSMFLPSRNASPGR